MAQSNSKVIQKKHRFTKTILNWSENNLRVFPWRETKEPYLILVAEIMLQRTKAEQVVPIFNSFIKKFPTPNVLAFTKEATIFEYIKPLGLKKRAAGLKQLGEQLLSKYDGKVPATEKELLDIFGVGQYAANAVLCYAFKKDTVTVDANVARVLDRVFTLTHKAIAQKDKNIHLFAKELIPNLHGKCREFNLGIIDLASLICTPKKPKCSICPVTSICDYSKSKFRAQ